MSSEDFTQWPAHLYDPASFPVQYDTAVFAVSRGFPLVPLPPKLAAQTAWALHTHILDAVRTFAMLTKYAHSPEWVFRTWWNLGEEYTPAMFAHVMKEDKHGMRPWLMLSLANNVPVYPSSVSPNCALVQTPDRKRYVFHLQNDSVQGVYHVRTGKEVAGLSYTGEACVLKGTPIYAQCQATKLPVVEVGVMRCGSSTGSMLPSVLMV